jgi:hypothetical protein
MNIHLSAKFGLCYTAILARVIVAFSSAISLSSPIWPVVINRAAFPRWAIFTCGILRAPLSITNMIAEKQVVTFQLSVAALKHLSASCTFNQGWATFISRVFTSNLMNALPGCFANLLAKMSFVVLDLTWRLNNFAAAIGAFGCDAFVVWAILPSKRIFGLPGVIAIYRTKVALVYFQLIRGAFEFLAALLATYYSAPSSCEIRMPFLVTLFAILGAKQVFRSTDSIKRDAKFCTTISALHSNHQKYPFGLGRIRRFRAWGTDRRSVRRSTGDQPVIAPRFNFSTGVL